MLSVGHSSLCHAAHTLGARAPLLKSACASTADRRPRGCWHRCLTESCCCLNLHACEQESEACKEQHAPATTCTCSRLGQRLVDVAAIGLQTSTRALESCDGEGNNVHVPRWSAEAQRCAGASLCGSHDASCFWTRRVNYSVISSVMLVQIVIEI